MRTFFKFLMAFSILGMAGCQATTPVTPGISTTATVPGTDSTPTPHAVTPTPPPPTPLPTLVARSAEDVAEYLGVDMGSPNDRGRDFVDVALTLRRWETIGADGCGEEDDACRYTPLDENGWPTTDARTVFFDQRPYGAWWGADQAQCPLCQDGDFMPDMSGDYRLIFSGQADLQGVEGPLDARNQRYYRLSNISTVDISVAPGQGLLFIQFVNTRRTPQSALHTGIADVRLLRPGYDDSATEIFTPEILEAVKPFGVLRFMNWVGGNNLNPPFADPDNTLEWAERTLPGTPQNLGEGVAWEYVIALANQTGKSVWINIPIHAGDDYVAGLAALLKDTLHPDARIYIEYSNEVWNEGFSQHAYNQAAAEAEIAAGNSPLNNDRTTLANIWGQRRYVRRLMEISNIFRDVFGGAAINTRIRVVHSWRIGEPVSYRSQLQWLNDTYGPPNCYLYAVAGTGYYNVSGAQSNDPAETLLAALQRSSRANVQGRFDLQQVASEFGLKIALYEAGPDTAGPLQWERDTQLLQTLIAVHRDPRIKDVLLYDLWNNWFALPGLEPDVYAYFTLQSPYSRWGMWGLTEDVSNLQTPKFAAIYDLAGITQSPPPAPVLLTARICEEKICLTWEPSFHAESYTVRRSVNEDNAFIPLADKLSEPLFSDSNIKPGNRYTYVVAAVNAEGEGQESLSATIAP
ncbi:MAG: fibronectin type III domain-containing protein [Anaerolineae bacterium]|nr:fibronectin type III domain-containing protein [Anaerolineae bacterium]